jgi:hypothetical protein
MPEYRVYTLTAENKIAGPSRILFCVDDQEAIGQAKQSLDGHDIEIWRGTRIISRLKSIDR